MAGVPMCSAGRRLPSVPEGLSCSGSCSVPALSDKGIAPAAKIEGIVESGFHRIPLARRAEAFRMNDQGWAGQIKNLARYVS
jgi:hypothetical protein